MPRINMPHPALHEAQPEFILTAGCGAGFGHETSTPTGDIHQLIDGEAYAWCISHRPMTRQLRELNFYPDSDL